MPRQFLISLALLFAALFFLLVNFPHESLWYDETTSAYLATHSWETLWEWATTLDIHPPLYFALLKLWVSAAGDSEFSLRLFSMLLGWLSFAGMIQLGYLVTGRWSGGWVAGLTLLFSGGFLYAAAEVRGYILGLTFAIGSLIFLLRWLRTNATPSAVMGGLLMLGAFYTHYAAIFLLPVQGLYVILHERGLSKRLWYFALPILGFLPWGLVANLPEGLSFEGTVPLKTVLQTYWEYFVYGQVAVDEAAWTLAILFGIFLLADTLFLSRQFTSLGILLTLLPIAGLTILILLGNGKLSGRHGWLMWIGIPLLIAGFMGIDKKPQPILNMTINALVLLTFFALMTFFIRPDLPDEYPSDFAGAFDYIEDHAAENDVLLLRDGTLFTAADYYKSPLKTIGLPNNPLTDVNHLLNFYEALDLIAGIDWSTVKNIWVISWQGDTMDPQEMVYALAEFAGGTPEETLNFGDVALARYEVERDLADFQQHIVDLPGLLQVPPDGASLLGGDVWQEQAGAGCDVIFHAWWWRGATDDENARVSYRVTGANGETYAQQDNYLSSIGYPQRQWIPNYPTLGRAVLTLPNDVNEVNFMLFVYDLTGQKPEQSISLGSLVLDQAPCSP